jgi:hypothetical protein
MLYILVKEGTFMILLIDVIIEFFFDLLLLDNITPKIKKYRTKRILLNLIKTQSWLTDWNKDPQLILALASDETVGELLLSKAYRKDLEENALTQRQFINLLDRIKNKM